MNTVSKIALAAVASLTLGAAQASVVIFETASMPGGVASQVSALAYQSAVNQAFVDAGAGAKSATVSVFDNLNNQSVFGGGNQNIAIRETVNFGLTSAATMDVRFGVDFGAGGALFLDGAALDFKSTDMWWNGSYADTTQSFQISGLMLGAGNHSLKLYGLEGCCDGVHQGQFSLNGGTSFTTFGAQDGLAAAVPEPESYALMLTGLAALGFVTRRQRTRNAA